MRDTRPHGRDCYGREVEPGDKMMREDGAGWASEHEITKVREDGMVQYRGDSYHWYSTEAHRITNR